MTPSIENKNMVSLSVLLGELKTTRIIYTMKVITKELVTAHR